jgi:hypothetical protein
MRGRVISLGAAFQILAAVRVAQANPSPGSMTVSSLSLTPLVIVLLTALGGGYAVRRRLLDAGPGGFANRLRLPRGPGVGGAFLLVALGINTLWAALLVAAPVFAILGFFRGVEMTSWGMRVLRGGDLPGHLDGAKPWRLIPMGVLLIASTFFLTAATYGFSRYHGGPSEGERTVRERDLVDRTADFMAAMRLEGERTGVARLPPLVPGSEGISRRWSFASSPDGRRFTILVPPEASAGWGAGLGRFPTFPFNYLVSQGAFRADESGRIRMVLSHHGDAVCPEDAPVVRQVSEEEIRRAVERRREDERRSQEKER